MAYTDIISLDDAKLYLRVDDTQTEDDTQITRMINGALSYVERYTNYILFARDKEYRLIDGKVRVYDYPINSEVTSDLESSNKTLHTIYTLGSDNSLITLNVGYVSNTDIPQELIEVAYEIIDIYYYGKESGKTMADLSPLSKDVLNNYKRFIL
jgi:hypothetical protein